MEEDQDNIPVSPQPVSEDPEILLLLAENIPIWALINYFEEGEQP